MAFFFGKRIPDTGYEIPDKRQHQDYYRAIRKNKQNCYSCKAIPYPVSGILWDGIRFVRQEPRQGYYVFGLSGTCPVRVRCVSAACPPGLITNRRFHKNIRNSFINNEIVANQNIFKQGIEMLTCLFLQSKSIFRTLMVRHEP